MEAALRLVKLVGLGILAFIAYRLFLLSTQPHEAVIASKRQLTNAVPFSLDLALHRSEWTVLVCLAAMSVVFMLFNIWRFQSLQNRLRRLAEPSHTDKV
jgi:hypothetical protein